MASVVRVVDHLKTKSLVLREISSLNSYVDLFAALPRTNCVALQSRPSGGRSGFGGRPGMGQR